ncbi:hypothetical protein [Treponema sp.]|uniref:hypothetical protein n=1 Tax=Treponema sp. TaxID=166 RepID=UPI00388F1F11
MKKIFTVFASFVFFFLLGCSKERTIDLNSSDSLSITPDQEWAVIKVPYAAFLQDCDYSSIVRAHARSGDVFLVKGKEFIKKEIEESNSKRRKKNVEEFELWYKFEEGCLSASLVDIYDTKLKAQTASEKLKKN